MPGLIADRPTEAAMTSLRVQVLIIGPRSPLAGGNVPASRWLLSDEEPLERLTYQYGLRLVCCQDACAASPGLRKLNTAHLLFWLAPFGQSLTFVGKSRRG
jgi:hypothetical protein